MPDMVFSSDTLQNETSAPPQPQDIPVSPAAANIEPPPAAFSQPVTEPTAFPSATTPSATPEAVDPTMSPNSPPTVEQAPTGQPTAQDTRFSGRNFLAQLPTFPVLILLSLAIVVVRFWQPADPLNWALQGVLFVVGAILGTIVFVFEPYFGRIANSIGESLANNRLTTDLPDIPNAPTSLTDSSPLKQGLLLFLLPIVGVFLVSSSRWAIGLGFLLGISWVYFADILAFLLNRPSHFPDEYFPPQQAQSRSVQTALVWYGLYMLILVLGLLFI